MGIEQLPPNKPNFQLIAVLSLAFMLVFFVIAYFTVRWDGQHLTFQHHLAEPHSSLRHDRPRWLAESTRKALPGTAIKSEQIS